MRRAAVLLVFVCSIVFAGEKKPPGVHISKTPGGVGYVLYVPKKVSGMVFLLHGAQFRDLNDAHGVWKAWANDFCTKGFLAIIPFAPRGVWGEAQLNELSRLAADLSSTYSVPRRMGAAIGHSSGAEGAFKLVAGNPSLLSAAVSLGGRPQVNAHLFKTKNLAGYFFHFTGDNIVPPGAARTAYNALKSQGAETAFEEAPGAGHAIEAYIAQSKKVVFNWLFTWFSKKARILGKVGQDESLNWEELGGDSLADASSRGAKLVLIYSFDSKKDKKSKACQWLEWDLFPNKAFQEVVSDLICFKWDRANADKAMLKKFSKFKRTGLYIVDVEKQKPVKSYRSARDPKRVVKEIKKLKEKYAKKEEKKK